MNFKEAGPQRLGNARSHHETEFREFVERLREVGYVTEIEDPDARMIVFPPTLTDKEPSKEGEEIIPKFLVNNKKTGASETLYFTRPGKSELIGASFWNGRWEVHHD